MDGPHAGTRSRVLAAVALGAALGIGAWSSAAAQEATLLAAGNVDWSRGVKPPSAYSWQPTQRVEIDVNGNVAPRQWTNIPYLRRAESREEIAARTGGELSGGDFDPPTAHHRTALAFPLDFESTDEALRHPFFALRDVIRGADLAFANLLTPLSDRARRSGAHLGDAAFADALRWAGFDVVSMANANALDGELTGLFDTMVNLRRAGVAHVGAGNDLTEARRAHVVEVNGISFALLGYTATGDFVNHEMAGVMPLDPILIEQDLRRVRDEVDFVVVSFHWPVVEASLDVHPDARAFARGVVDAGADVVLGHHPHVEPAAGGGGRGGGAGPGGSGADLNHPHSPKGVELHDGRPIFHSLGNFVFGHGHTYWGDNYVARLTFTTDRITRIDVLPVAGRGNDVAQPYLLSEERAARLLEQVRDASVRLGTQMEIEGDRGVIRP